MVNVGTIVSVPLNNSDNAYLAQYEADIPDSANVTPATLIKLVSTGPGHNMLICTLLPASFNSSYIELVRLVTYALVA